MKVLILDAALALPTGTPRQRRAEAVRASVAAAAEVAHVALDPFATEWGDRLRMAAGDALYPAARRLGPRPFAALPRLDADAPMTEAEVEGGALAGPAWMGPRRWDRLARRVAAQRPDLILVADPALAGLAPRLRALARTVALDDGAAAWHRAAARRAGRHLAARWHLRMADLVDGAVALAPDLLPLDLGPGGPAEPDLAPRERVVPRGRTVVVAASGLPWLDRPWLDALGAALADLGARGAAPDHVAALGLPPEDVTRLPGGVAHDWADLGGLAVTARALALPALPPALRPLAEGALRQGTPVVLDPADAAHHGLLGRPGVLAALPGDLWTALAAILDDGPSPPEAFAAVAAASLAAAEARPPRPAPPWSPAPWRAVPFAGHRPRRVPPLRREPRLRYGAPHSMLLLNAEVRTRAGIEEVRLLDAQGQELHRVLPSAGQRRLRVARVEGAVIVPRPRLDGGLRVELRDQAGCVESRDVPTEAVEEIEAGIALARMDGVVLAGAFWARDGAAGLALGTDAVQADVAEASPRLALPDLGIEVVPFRVPLRPAPRAPLAVWTRHAAPLPRLEQPGQRPLEVGGLALEWPPRRDEEVEALRDRHRGRRAWIIGNGPSVRMEDLAAIPRDDVTICFNRFYLSYGSHPLREDYVVSSDTLMVADFGQEMIDVSTGLAVFCMPPRATRGLVGDYLNLRPGDAAQPIFSTDPAAWVSIGGSSVYVALQLALHMGLRDVALYGIDYAFSLTPVRDPRYAFPVSFDEGNHFISGYRGAKPWVPPTWRDISTGFLNARIAFELAGGRVVNATRGGRLEIFPRQAFDDLAGRPPA